MRKNSVCYNCPERHLHCHSTCEIYKAETAKRTELNETMYHAKTSERQLMDILVGKKHCHK